MKFLTLAPFVFSTIFLSACGGSGNSSNSSVTESMQIGQDTYTCTTSVAAAACVVANTTGKTEEALIKACVDADCSCSGPTCGQSPATAVACSTTSNELAEGKSCTYKGVTYTCTAGIIKGGPFSATTITLNDFSVKCK